MSNGYLIDSGLNRDTVLDLVSRVASLETAIRPVAFLKGNLTGGGAANSFTVSASQNLSIVSLSATGINFAFGTNRPNVSYGAQLIPTSGIATLGDCSMVSEALGTFTINTATNGAVADPRAITTEFFVFVIHTGA